jgi:hypothetical protein
MNIVKKIIIKQEETKEGIITSIKIDGFSEYEVIGLLAYYKDLVQVNVMRDNFKIINK